MKQEVWVTYARISDKDQSRYSIPEQLKEMRNYAQLHNKTLDKEFVEKGKSAFTFDRPEWKDLEKYLKQNKHVTGLLVYSVDRFSRADLMDAYVKLHEIERRLKVKVYTCDEDPDQDRNSMVFQLIRTVKLLEANSEYNKIKERTNRGIHGALTSGRFCNRAPRGYLNGKDPVAKDSNGKPLPLLVIDKAKAPYIRKVFQLYHEGAELHQIWRMVPELKIKGRSTIKDILQNCLYAGLVYVKPYKGKPGYHTDGVHEAIIPKHQYYAIQKRLQRRGITVQPSYDVWLRGVLLCHCGRQMTAGNSRSSTGRYYWYYRCDTHLKNYSATKLHAQFMEVLQNLSKDKKSIQWMQATITDAINKSQAKKGGDIMRIKLELSKVQDKLKTTQERFLLNQDIDPMIYTKVVNDLKAEESRLEIELEKKSVDTAKMKTLINDLLPRLERISEVFEMCTLHQKQLFITTVFSDQVYYIDGIYRTPTILPIFADKLLILKEKRLLEIQQPIEKNGGVSFGTVK